MTAKPKPLPESVVVELDIYSANGYVSVECQLNVHRACPGGLHGDTRAADWICHCRLAICPCRQKLVEYEQRQAGADAQSASRKNRQLGTSSATDSR